MKNEVILIGGFSEIIELCEDNNVFVVGIVDNNSFGNIPTIGSDQNVNLWRDKYLSCNLLITPDSPFIREKLAVYYGNLGFGFSTLISSLARVSKSAKIDNGTLIQSGVNISSEVLLGRFVKVNTNANIMHNSIVGDYSTIAPNAVILGNVRIGRSCYIGANATILPNITICDNAVIGAGSVVTKDIISAQTSYAGVPARPLNK